MQNFTIPKATFAKVISKLKYTKKYFSLKNILLNIIMWDLGLKLLLKQTYSAIGFWFGWLILKLHFFWTCVHAHVFILFLPLHIRMHPLASLLFFLSLCPSCIQALWCVAKGKLAVIFFLSKKRQLMIYNMTGHKLAAFLERVHGKGEFL